MEYRMKYAEDFRRIARGALTGKWVIAAIAGLIASILCGVDGGGLDFNFNLAGGEANLQIDCAGHTLFSTGSGMGVVPAGLLAGGILYIVVLALALAAIYFVLGSVVDVGYSRFNLEVVGGRRASLEDLAVYIPYWKKTAMTRLVKSIRIFVGMICLVVPGIVMSYSYAMSGYIQAEHPEFEAEDILALSQTMMEGNRWRFFCLQVSFIGWDILCALTGGLGNLVLRPYKQAAFAAFYREVSGAESGAHTAEPYNN